MLLALLLVLADPIQARQHLEKARGHIEQLRYDRALEELDAALRAGDASPRDLAAILRALGEVNAALELPTTASEYFQRLLALDPSADLGDVSPKIAQPFTDAKTALAGRPPLTVHSEIVRAPATAVVLVVDSDPLAMVAGARAVVGNRRIEGRGGLRIELPLPAGEHIEVAVSAIDRYGNRLVDLAPLVVEAPARPPVYARWWPWALAAGATAATGLVFGLLAKSNDDDARAFTMNSALHDYREVQSLEDAAHRDALIANINFGVAGACAVVSAILLVRTPGSAETTPSFSPSHAGLSLRWRF
jgi:hypothetical protein